MPSDDPSQDPAEGAQAPTGVPEGPSARWPVRSVRPATQQVETFLNRAQAQIQMQRWADALVSLDAAIALHPVHGKAHELRAQVLARMGRT